MPELAIRPYEDTDEEPVLALLAASLGKTVDDRYRRFIRWKHLENPFGRSFMWVGEVDERVIGFRSFLRWRFRDAGAEPVEAVRAVDTATHPDAQGMGVFRTLTMHALDEMSAAGISFVFNTPNDQSRPGYLKMGWRLEGRVPVKVRPRSLVALVRTVRARQPAEAWSLPTTVGEPIDSVADHLATTRGPNGHLVTDRSPAFLRWRYAGCPEVGSVAVPAGDGAVLVRYRTRGPAVECTVGDVVGPVSSRGAGSALRRAVRLQPADYALAAAGSPIGGMVEVARLGPVLARRDVSPGASQLPLDLSLGDVELF